MNDRETLILEEIDRVKQSLRQGETKVAQELLQRLLPVLKSIPIERLKSISAWDWTITAAAVSDDVAFIEHLQRETLLPAWYRHPLKISPVSSLGDWCNKNGVPQIVVQPSAEVILPPTHERPTSATYRTDPAIFATLAGGRWCPGWDFAWAVDGTVLVDTSYLNVAVSSKPFPHEYVGLFQRIVHHLPTTYDFREGDAVYFSAPYGFQFGHYLIDFLPRLQALDCLNGRSAKIVVPDDIPKKMIELFSLWGLTVSDLFLCRRDTHYQFERLHIFKTGRSMPPPPAHVQYIRRHLYTPPTSRKSTPGRRIFASRGVARARNIANWREVEALLEEEGFLEVDFAQLSIEDQRELMANADVLLGVFGSNLFSIYLAPAGCQVIALMPAEYRNPTIEYTSILLGLRHTYFNCESLAAGHTEKRKNSRSWDVDLVVDVAALKRVIQDSPHHA